MKKFLILNFCFLWLTGCSYLGIHEVNQYQEAKSVKPVTSVPKGKPHYPIPKLATKTTNKTSNDLITPPNMNKKYVKASKSEEYTHNHPVAGPIEKVMSAID